MKTILLPIDDRPVTCLYPQMVAKLAGITAFVPPRQMLGALTRSANPEHLQEWLDAARAAGSPNAILLCLDSLLYGGLVSSRRSNDTPGQVLQRTACLQRWRQKEKLNATIFGQASIMRISDNYDATEEKEYWARYGKEIFAWSSLLHRLARGEKPAAGQLANLEMKIPEAVRTDYLQTRKRNFQASQTLLSRDVAEGNLDLLVFSLDDSGQTGLNVLEKERLLAKAQEIGVSDRVLSYPGADEVLLALLARLLVQESGRRARAQVIFSPAESAHCPSRYEGQAIGQTISAQMAACGIEQERSESHKTDFVVLVHGWAGAQGDHILLPGEPDMRSLDTARSVAQTLDILAAIDKPVVLCDVAYANGADPAMVEALLERPDLVGKLWAYAGWNTTGNTVGSALATGVATWFASKDGVPAEALKRCLFVRLADDWAYQSVVRRTLNGPADGAELRAQMDPYLQKIASALDYIPALVSLSHPWQRTFEIEVAL